MKKLLTCICLALLTNISAMATALENNGEYYIWLNIYEKLLGSNEAGNGPALSAYGTKSDGYVFVAEDSGKSGYVLLRQKSSGKYLAASSANNWSVTLESKSTADRFCWQTEEGTYVYIINKKSGKYLGIDGANKGSNYVSVYYDKPKGSHSQYSIIPATGNNWDEARQAYESGVYTNAQGVSEIDYCQLNGKTIDRSDAIDIHITANDNPMLNGSKVNLGSDRTWLIIDNIVPSKVISDYLQYVTINGKAAKNGSNCRVAIYLNGAAVIPTPSIIMDCDGTDGSFTLKVGNYSNLGELNNTMKSFTLRRGYMATLASGTNGSGHSHVYVADHSDLDITLPEALNLRVSSVNIKPWQYLSKKGWGDTGGATKGPQLRATWYWAWNADYNSTTDMEYVPCRQHRWWPGADLVNSKTATASLSLNEPEHAEQHTSDKCSCGGTIDSWTAYGINKDFQAGGGRIGSPQPTDFSYLTQYFKYIDENNNESRCDFAVTHAYWDIGSRDANSYATYVTDQCWTIWNNTKRPVWLTEMEVGASWFSNTDSKINSYDAARNYLQVLLQKLEECDYIERYAIYSFDFWRNKMFYDDGGITPAGQVYRDHRSTFAYHASKVKDPVWWRPSVQKPTLQFETSGNNIIILIGNPNGDIAEELVLERKTSGGSWEILTTISERSKLDPTTVRYTISTDDIDRTGDSFRVTVNTLYGGSATSEEMKLGYISNPEIVAESKSNIPGWTCERSAQNGYTKADNGDTYFEVWNPTAGNMGFNYYQDLGALPPGVYELSAVCFNSSNKESGAYVNGNVGLYAQAEGVEYYAPVTTDSEIDYNNATVISQILVRNGTMRIGIKNQGSMTARWAGADNFELKYLGTEEDVLTQGGDKFVKEKLLERDEQLTALFTDLDDGQKDASVLIVNPDCNRGGDREEYYYFGWTIENQGINSGQAWDGNNNNTYWDKWNSGSLSSSMEQTIGYLPNGEYEVSALLRCSTGQTITFSATHNGDTYTKTLTGIGDQSPSGSEYQRGWQKVTLPSFTALSGDQLVISASIDAQVTTWWSADHFTLTWKPSSITVGVSNLESQAPTDDIIYDLQGRRIKTPSANGIYIRNGKKHVK
ncbi:MAG: RICIN domain-containing protein [Prevotella sp.]|nr:RICIN domain-containing protein [Prevotella sp.]